MQRRDFLVLFGSLPLLSLAQEQKNTYSAKLITGKTEPNLFGTNHRLQKEASDEFLKMQKEAKKEGIKLFSVSSYRNFDDQTRIWNSKFEKYKKQGLKGLDIIDKIIEYSAYPGASRHHWGTDLDISDLAHTQPQDPLNPKHFLDGGIYNKMYEWMNRNASRYGFYEAYTQDKKRKGFNFEPWHYSYAPISKILLKDFLELDFDKHLKSTKIKGHELLDNKFWDSYRENYVLGINPALK